MNTEDKKPKKYLDKLIDASPGTGGLAQKSGLDIDLSKLTIAGWILAVLTVAIAGTSVIFPILMYSSNGGGGGGIVRAIGLPIALVLGGGVFWVGKKILGVLRIPIVKE